MALVSRVFEMLVLASFAHVCVLAVEAYPVGLPGYLSGAQLARLPPMSACGPAIVLIYVAYLRKLVLLKHL